MKKLILFVLVSMTAMALLPLIAAVGNPPDAEEKPISIAASEIPTGSSDLQNIAAETSYQDDMSSKKSDSPTEIEPSEPTVSVAPDIQQKQTAAEAAPLGFSEDQVFKIYDTSSGEVISVPDREFCIGALAYELPPGAEPEALKAQCIACYTHFCRLREQQRSQPNEALHGADWAADLSSDEGCLSDATMREKWGKLYETSRQKLEQAVDACGGLVITDRDGRLIDAAYHAMSAGVTESAADIFGQEDAHLQPVASPWDRSAPDFCTTKKLSETEFVKLLSAETPAPAKKDILAEKDFSARRTSSGAVKVMTIGGQEYTGARLRTVFSLRSADFELAHVKKQFVFTVYGYGHGVGMSQTGARGMAAQGADYREILLHYYTDVFIRPYPDH